ncbi:hypothetical protein [Mechercharimyces sp. CAU 1602]|uniref:hypothetical protein n=1 Tax=Mechercharimyces sp. CAU 1602 TaxID=2973933 RepID=UPI00216366C4|nr:hypothetical protein [Mechercharimyces sp. CAU 1602]MCS1350189.1 hypothetical protein [Mechercharimyces sp. CAU 1602]
MIHTKKGRYNDVENEEIISFLNQSDQVGKNDRELIQELASRLNRGYTGIAAHVRKLRLEHPERFPNLPALPHPSPRRLNSWSKEEEEQVIATVNSYSQEGQPISLAIRELETKLSRTQGAIYQRVYHLRKQSPERFHKMPSLRPRRPRLEKELTSLRVSTQEVAASRIDDWLSISSIDKTDFSDIKRQKIKDSDEVRLLLLAFEQRYGKANDAVKQQLIKLIQHYGPTRFSIMMFMITEDKQFPETIAQLLTLRLQEQYPF